MKKSNLSVILYILSQTLKAHINTCISLKIFHYQTTPLQEME